MNRHLALALFTLLWETVTLEAAYRLRRRFPKETAIGSTLAAGLALAGLGIPAAVFLLVNGSAPQRVAAAAIGLYLLIAGGRLTRRAFSADAAALEKDAPAIAALHLRLMLLLWACLLLVLVLVWPVLAPAFGVYPDGR